jgi:hypothetical protein
MPRRIDRSGWVALGLGLIFFAVVTAITWAEHGTYNSTSLDMAVYTQLVWNTANGHPFETTLLLQNRLHLAEHLALLLLPLAPLFAILPRVELLLVLQQSALALSGYPVYRLARCKLGPAPALMLLAGYYAMPTLAEVALDAFYPIVFTTLPLGAAAALALTGRARPGALLALAPMLWEEEAALLAVGIGLYLLPRAGEARKIGLVVVASGFLWLGVGESIVMPRFRDSDVAAETRPGEHFGQLRTRPLDWLGTIALNRLEPDGLRATGLFRGRNAPEPCSDPGHCSALRWWLYPTGGLALLSPATLLIDAPEAAALLLADKPGRFRRHWAAPMLPVIWLAAVGGLAWLGRRRFGRIFGLALLIASGVWLYYLDSPLPLGTQYEAGDVVTTPLGADLARLGGEIPGGASVAASRRGLAHLANRRELYAYPPREYAPWLWPPPRLPDYALVDLRNRDSAAELTAGGSAIRPAINYEEVERTPNVVLLRRSGAAR